VILPQQNNTIQEARQVRENRITESNDEIESSEIANREASQAASQRPQITITETNVRDQPKILNCNDNVTIKHIMSGKLNNEI
jgi:preprotein translocase subunit SecA